MKKGLRKSGIDVVGEVPWGTHFCQFYQTKQDLIDILVPYFKAGLENNEFCMWVTSHPLEAEEAKEALGRSVPDIDVYLAKGQIEIIPYDRWYIIDGVFDSQRVLNGWIEKLDKALAKGYDGLRLNGNLSWLERGEWNEFIEYEEQVDNIIGNHQMMALCAYPLDKCTAIDIIDVVVNHQFALVKKEGKWEQIESSRRKKEEERAFQATQHWGSTFDTLPDPISILDNEYRIIRANQAMAKRLGMAPEECKGLTCYQAVHGTDKPPSFCPHRRLLEDGLEHTVELYEDNLGGYFIVSVSPLHNSEGKIIGSVHVARDINERKQAEETLRDAYENLQMQSEELEAQTEELQKAYEALNESEKQYRMLFTNMTEGFVLGEPIYDKDGKPCDYRFLDVNPAFELQTGLKREEILGRTIRETLYNPNYLLIEKCGEVALSGEPTHIEIFSQELDRYLDSYIFSPEKGKFAVILRDITKRKQAEEALREIEARRKVAEAVQVERERLNNVLDMLPAYVALISPDYHVRFANRFFEERFGKSEGRRCYEYLFQRTEPCENCETCKVFKTGAPHHWEWTGPDGRNYDVYDYPFKDFDGSTLVMEMGIDITEIKQAQAAAQAERQRFFEVLETLPALISLMTPDYHVAFANRSFREKFGESNNQHCYEYCYGRTDPCEFCEIYKVIETGQPHHWESNIPDGSVGDCHAFPFTDIDGSPMILLMNIDITEQKRAEAELKKHKEQLEKAYKLLKESEEDLAEAQRMAHLGNWSWNIENNELYWSDEVYRIFGLTPQEFRATYDSFLSYIHPEDREYVDNAVKEALNGKPYSIDHRIILDNGEERILHEQAEVIFNEEHIPVRMRGTVQDITEQKKAEEALKLANAYNRSLIEASIDPFVTISPDGKITDVNHSTEIVTGYSRKELIGTDFSDYFTEPEKAREGYQRVFQEGSVRDYPLEIRHRNGKITPVLYNASVYRNEAGEVVGIFAAARDITEQKKAEEALRLSNMYNRSLLEASLDPLVTIGADGKITDVNRATELVTGYSRNELIGTDFSDYFTDPEKASEGYRQVFREGLVLDYELAIQHRTGNVTPVLYNASVYRNEAGEVIGVFAAARNITELKKAEQLLKLKLEELARSNAELEQFAYVSSHDLQEPLRMIASYLQLLQRKYQGKLDEKADKYIYFAVDGASRMQNLINDLLEFSRVTTRAKEFEPTDCESILDQVISDLEIPIKENEASISYGKLPVVMADSTQLTQVFQNLISNAIKFRSEKAPEIEISAKKKDNEWLFAVKDNGIGIESKFSERIFEVFKRLNKREEYPGTGIGLSICKKIVERHGGRIWVESVPGEGSVFYFTLPIIPVKSHDKDSITEK
ncbi:PAS domain S-box-containing protein [Methanosarcina thermophila]|jgi:PAS domain S-box-containing protein|uniref:histidine kinase n=3 Tax=Methanosarcina thermophila TaxID=2210 RepID=A0A1I6XZ92_METTE|nr:PAS domain S-box protein [Methanosarcina thermophila]AKB12752.1 sensory transduction histidine kinase [Methanosarcina thermophila TM-1]SFT43271.1 PAS domain S-box-containing protein [Methanosarcina thermophila]BAW30491.1 PAS domain S-box [Methanosarcina thermophila]GLI13372.1 hypothetical protein MTHERMMSTA1_04980 [Methanosarcina thermophila MST-A1]HOA68332.1 PAS domain S-box protein [Methanosarcina thermophila]